MAEPKTSPEDRLEERAEDVESLREAQHELSFGGDQRELTGEVSVVGQHPADVSDFTFQRELDLTVEHILDREAEQIHEAMRAREEGRYGVCQNCGREISKERLEARPEATLCIDCQRDREAGRLGA